jgi:chromosome segregation ATPase
MVSDMEKITGLGTTNFKRVRDKIMGELFENIKKGNQLLTKSNMQRMDYQSQISDYKTKIQKGLKSKNMLTSICESLLKQNNEIYEKHEKMLDYEKQQRSIIGEGFQEKMNQINENLQSSKGKRQGAFEANEDLRTKINIAIEDYKNKEQVYNDKMEEHNKHIQKIQDQF